jgi:hypothetical protein
MKPDSKSKNVNIIMIFWLLVFINNEKIQINLFKSTAHDIQFDSILMTFTLAKIFVRSAKDLYQIRKFKFCRQTRV